MCVILLIWAFFVGFRNNIGFDWGNYVEFYNTGVAPDKISGSYEPLFGAVRWLVYSLGFRYELFFFILSCFSLGLIEYVARDLKINNIYLVFLVYVSLFFCYFQFNIVRSGIMASCIWVSFIQQKNGDVWKAVIWCLIAAGFHVIALAFLPIVLSSNRLYSTKVVITLLVVSYTVMLFKIDSILISRIPFLYTVERLSGYIDPSNIRGRGLSLGSVFNLAFFSYLYFGKRVYYLKNPNYRLAVNVMLWGLFITSFFSSIGMIATRMGQALNMSLVFVWPLFFSVLKKGAGVKFCLVLLMTVYLLLFFVKAFQPDADLGYSSFTPFVYQFDGVFR